MRHAGRLTYTAADQPQETVSNPGSAMTDDRRPPSASVLQRVGSTVRWRRLLSRPVQYSLDLLVLVLAFMAAYAIRFDFVMTPEIGRRMLSQLPYVVLFQFAALNIFGVYSFVWRYVGLAEVGAFLRAAWWSFLPVLVIRLALPSSLADWRVPISVILIDTTLAFGGSLGIRVLRRSLYERFEKNRRSGPNGDNGRKPVLLVGAGRAGVLAAREIAGRGETGLVVEGFVDDDPEKLGTVINGIRVLGTTRDLPRLVDEHRIDHVVITIARANRLEIRRIIEICEQVPVKARIIPGLYEILDGSVEVSRIRDVEIEDLLGRDAVHLEEETVAAFLEGNTVMVTGAGGSIGSELARQVARFRAGNLVLLERAEFALFDIDRELRQAYPDLTIVPIVADVCDERRLRAVMSAYRPAVVVHAAAHKHVPMMETNPTEAVKNNILGTRLVGEVAGECGAEAFILISTDKAVRPTSVMGASKRVAELVVQDLEQRFPTRYVSVRFGNVLGSAGSVIPIFRKQILAGGPVTVTHPDMVRYFMTIPEASQLVLQAGAMGDGGEIFILDMGEPVRILDMAKDMIRLFGLQPFEDIDIVFTGVRPGEKLFEELETDGEEVARTRHPKILNGMISGYPGERIAEALAQFEQLAVDGREAELRRFLNELLPEARVSE